MEEEGREGEGAEGGEGEGSLADDSSLVGLGSVRHRGREREKKGLVDVYMSRTTCIEQRHIHNESKPKTHCCWNKHPQTDGPF